MNNATDYNLDEMVASWAVEIFEQAKDEDQALEWAHEYVDGCEWVIYFYKAHELCAGCNIDMGEDFVADCGEPEDGWSYDGIASAIAYGEIVGRLNSAIQGLFEMEEEAA